MVLTRCSNHLACSLKPFISDQDKESDVHDDSEANLRPRMKLPATTDDLPAFPRDNAVKRTRRATNLTAAALVIGAAATTGYLAHTNAAAANTSSGTAAASGHPGTAGHHKAARAKGHATTSRHKGSAARHKAPRAKTHVATSGGSGVAGAAGGDS